MSSKTSLTCGSTDENNDGDVSVSSDKQASIKTSNATIASPKRKQPTFEPFDSPSKHVHGKKAKLPSGPSDDSQKKRGKISLVAKYLLEEIPFAIVVPFYGKTVAKVGCPPSALPFMNEITGSENNSGWNLELMSEFDILCKYERRSINSGHCAMKSNPTSGTYTAHQYLTHANCNIDHIAKKMSKASKAYDGTNEFMKNANFQVCNEDPIYGKGENIRIKCSKAFTNEGLVHILHNYLLPDGMKRAEYTNILNDEDEGEKKTAEAMKYFGVDSKEDIIDFINQYWD